MHISHKTLVLYVTLLVAAFTFILASECNAQRGFGRLPRRQQQIENRVRQISPSTSPTADQQPTPAAEEKAKETPTPAAEEKAEEKPAPAAEEKAEEKPAPAAEEKAEEKPTPASEKKTRRPSWKKNVKETPAPAEAEDDEETPNGEASIIKNETKVPEVLKEEKSDPESMIPDLEEDLSDDAPELLPDPLHEEAVKKVLADPNVPEEAKTVLKQATKEDIQKSVKEATSEVEADNQNEHIDGVVENSRKEVDEDSIETAVNEVLDSSEETMKEELKRSGIVNEEEVVDDSIPDSVNQVLKDIETKTNEKVAETPAFEVDGDDAEEDDAEDEPEADAAEDDDAEDEAKDEPEADAATEESIVQAPANAKTVKMADLNQELKVPENATFEQLHAYLVGLDSLAPADLDQSNQEVMMNQAKTFIEKVFQAKLAASNQMLALEGLTDEQWREAVSWKVQSLAGLFQLDGSKVEEMRKFANEIRPKTPNDLMWTIESILIQMELAQITEKPEPEELKQYVSRMLEHTQKGIDENCVSLDFVFATVQMVVLTEDSLPKEESKAFFESAIKTLNSSEMPKLKEMAKFLQKILDQREIVGKTPDLTLETYDGKTVKTADFVGKTLLIYYFQMSSKDQLQDLGLVYQIYLVFHSRGLEVIGIVPEEKTDAMDELLAQIPWPMVFEGKDAETSAVEKLCVPTFPAKVLVNAEGKIENGNIQPMDLLKYLETVYGPVSKSSEDEEAEEDEETEAEEETEETEAPDLSGDEADETPGTEEIPDAKEDADVEEDAGAEEDKEDEKGEMIEPPAKEAPKAPVKEAKEKADELDLDLDSIL